MNRQALLLLLIPAAGAFSPAALQSQQHISTRTCTNVRSNPFSSNNVVGQSFNNNAKKSLQPLFFHNVNSDGSNNSKTSTSLAMSTAAAAPKSQNKKKIAMFMAFMTGWGDVLFLKKYGYFGTMMTGNSMKLADALVNRQVRDGIFFASIIFAYMFGVGIFRRAELSFQDKSLNGLFAPIVAGGLILGDYVQWAKPGCRLIPGLLFSFCWGIINQVGSEVTGTLMFVLTGGMTRLSNMIVDRISRTAGRKKIPKDGFRMGAGVISGFILGAAWCSFLGNVAPQLATHGAFSIMGGIYGLLFLWLDRTKLGAWWNQEDGKLCDIDAEEVDCK